MKIQFTRYGEGSMLAASVAAAAAAATAASERHIPT